MKKLFLLFFLANAAMLFNGCTKDDTSNSNSNSSTPTPSFGDGIGVMAAVTTVTYTTVMGTPFPTELNTAVAAFMSTPGSTTYVDAGNVSLNSAALKKYDNNTYLYDNVLSPISFSSIQWTVEGKNDVPAVNKTVTRGMPEFSDYSGLPSSVSKSAGFSVSLGSNVSNADSVYVVFSDMGDHYLIKRVKGNGASVTFSASDLADFKTGTALLQVAPWNYSSESISGKLFYFVNEAVVSKMDVTLN